MAPPASDIGRVYSSTAPCPPRKKPRSSASAAAGGKPPVIVYYCRRRKKSRLEEPRPSSLASRQPRLHWAQIETGRSCWGDDSRGAEGECRRRARFDPSFPALKIQSQLMAALLPPHDEVCVKTEEDGLGAIVPVDLFINLFPLVEDDGFEVAPWPIGNAHNATIAELYGTPQVSAPPTSPI